MLSVEGVRLEGDQVTSMPWDAQGEAHAALRAIVADPRYGLPALSNAQTMTNLLKDMLPDAPRESSVLVAASEVGVADMLQSNVSQGMDVATASRLAAGTFENRTALTPDACNWAVGDPGLGAEPGRPPAGTAAAPSPGIRHPVARRHPAARRRSADRGAEASADVPGVGHARPAVPVRFRPAGRAQAHRRGLTAVAAILIVWACALPDLHVPVVVAGLPFPSSIPAALASRGSR